jgi:hypothetical protein
MFEKTFAIMAHQSAGGFPSGDPSKDGPVNKRPVPLSSEKGNHQPEHPAHRSAQPNALMFAEPSPGPAAFGISHPPVNSGQNNTLPSSATAQWSSEAGRTQASITAAAAEAENSPPAEDDPGADNDMSTDGSNETDFLNKALSAFSLHTESAANRTQALPDIEKKRINDAMLRADSHNEVPHSIMITVKASVALATGQAANGKMAQKARADPLSRDFAKYLEDLLLTAAGSSGGACTFKFSRLRKKTVQNGGEFVSAGFRIAFAEKVFTNRILKSNLSNANATLMRDFSINMQYEVAVQEAPFQGQVYHCPIMVDFKNQSKNESVPVREYVSAAFHGGMNSKAFTGIRRGQTIKKDGSGKKIHDHFELYFDPTLTANHGSQELSDKVIDMQELYGESFPVPLHPITEPPCYIAWKDSTGFIHKRELMKSGDNWCQHCWGKHSGHCIYYNFCKRCLAFNPQGNKYKDFKLNRHLCNYGVHQMPNQKTPKNFVEPQQKFDAERQAHFDAQKKQADAMSDVAAQNLQLKILAVKEKKRKAAEALAERKAKRGSKK